MDDTVTRMSEIPENSISDQARNPKADAKAAKAYAKASRPWFKKKRWWVVGAVLLIIIISVANSGASDSGDTAADNGGSSTGDNSAKEKAPKAMKVQATRILKDFEDNEAAADGKYKGKTLQIKGVVAKVDTEIFDDSQYVVQIGGGGQFEFFTVNCDDQKAGDVSALKKGDDITVLADFEDGGDLGVELKHCNIL